MSESAPGPSRWARLLTQDQGRYPAIYHQKWFRVLERHDSEIPPIPGCIWIDVVGNEQQVWEHHFEIAEMENP
jgi:hypothetical protein